MQGAEEKNFYLPKIFPPMNQRGSLSPGSNKEHAAAGVNIREPTWKSSLNSRARENPKKRKKEFRDTKSDKTLHYSIFSLGYSEFTRGNHPYTEIKKRRYSYSSLTPDWILDRRALGFSSLNIIMHSRAVSTDNGTCNCAASNPLYGSFAAGHLTPRADTHL